MNDQLIMENYLLVLKSTVEVYVHGTLESANKDVRMLLKLGLDSTLDSQANTFLEMMKRNWYQVNNVESKQITKLLSDLNKN